MYSVLPQFRFELDPLWPRLSDTDRHFASLWAEVARRMTGAKDKTAEVVRVQRDFTASLGPLSRSTIYRKVDAMKARGLVGVVSVAAIRRAQGVTAAPSLPPSFVSFWRSLCGDHQRRKTLPAWRRLMRDYLMAGRIIPGYSLDWRGIWAKEHPGEVVPERCPYTDIHQGAGACSPRGWSYSSMLQIAPEPDAMAGAAVGVQAMLASTPTIPHTRVGLRPMQVITMDDVQLDQLCWFPGEQEPRRPVGLGVEDVATGNLIDFTVVPVQRRADGTLAKLDGSHKRYVWANILCNLGVDARCGLTALLEHGTAGLETEEEERINALLGPRPDGGKWLTVLRSSTSGAPLLKGLFAERGRGRPTHKAMLESAWNLLHNELASLPAPSGKDWDNAPQDVVGWTREDKALIQAGAALLAHECPAVVEALAQARTHALPFCQLRDAVNGAIAAINGRRDHKLEGWIESGYVKHMVEIGGAVVSLDAAADSLSGGDESKRQAVLETLGAMAKPVRMSPREAWASYDPKTRKYFSPFVGTRILGPELAQTVTIDARHQFTARNDFSGELSLFAATFRNERGQNVMLEPGTKLQVWVNPLRFDWAIACTMAGEFVGVAPMMAPTIHGGDASANLGVMQLFRSAAKGRAAVAAAGRVMRNAERKRGNSRAIAKALAAVPSGDEAMQRLAAENHVTTDYDFD